VRQFLYETPGNLLPSDRGHFFKARVANRMGGLSTRQHDYRSGISTMAPLAVDREGYFPVLPRWHLTDLVIRRRDEDQIHSAMRSFNACGRDITSK